MKKRIRMALSATTAIALASGITSGLASLEAGTHADHPATSPLILAAGVSDTHTADERQSEDERLQAFFEEIFQRDLANSPILQMQIGMKTEKYGQWDDFSDAEATRSFEENKQDLARLQSEFDYDKLSEPMQVSYEIFKFLEERDIRGYRWRHHDYTFSTMNNPIAQIASLLQNVHRVDTVEDAEAYISRLKGIEGLTASLMESMRLSEAKGIVPTSFSFEPILTDTKSIISGAPFGGEGDNALMADFVGKVEALSVDGAEKKRLIAGGEAAFREAVIPSVDAFLADVERLREKSHGPNGVWALPDGDDFYQNQVFFWTSEDISGDAIHQIGLKEVERIKAEMQTVMEQTGFEGSLAEFFTFLREDPSNFFPATPEGQQAYLDQSKAYIDAVYDDVDQYFNILPKAPLEVRKVEEWREETAPIAFYNRPSPDGSRPGIYYTNLNNMASKQKHEMETIAYHEGAPGHHFQIAIQQELTGVPTFQKFAFFSSYAEGWGLYAERLGKEQGRFTDPLQDFGRLQNEMLRAVRLVVDSGLHSKKWTREQAIEYMLDNNPISEHEAAKEVERYIDLPGQATGYKLGMLKILDLRQRAREALGDRFDIRDFHDVVLKNGAVSLPLLEKLVDSWIAQSLEGDAR